MTDYNNSDNSFEEDLPEVETYQKIFNDGSRICINEFGPDIVYPYRRKSKPWIAEEIQEFLVLHEFDMEESIAYIEKNYKE